MDIRLDRRFRDDFLAQRLLVDCRSMRVNVALFKALRHVKSTAMIVLATDNMDCFQQTFDHVRKRTRRPTAESETLADWAVICDDIVCSSEVARSRPIASRTPSMTSPNRARSSGVSCSLTSLPPIATMVTEPPTTSAKRSSRYAPTGTAWDLTRVRSVRPVLGDSRQGAQLDEQITALAGATRSAIPRS
jgi:hypothetical protein